MVVVKGDAEGKKESDKAVKPKHVHKKKGSRGIMIIMAEVLEKVLDGIFLGVTFSSSSGAALATFIAVWLHEFPMAMSTVVILMDSGWGFGGAFFMTVALNALLFLGAGLGLAFG